MCRSAVEHTPARYAGEAHRYIVPDPVDPGERSVPRRGCGKTCQTIRPNDENKQRKREKLMQTNKKLMQTKTPTSSLCMQTSPPSPSPSPLPAFTPDKKQCLTAFLRIPAEVAMVQAADKLFYHSRPSHVAPLHPRSSSVADNSLSLSEGDAGQSSHGYSQGKSRPPSRRGASGVRRNGKPIVEEVGGLSV